MKPHPLAPLPAAALLLTLAFGILAPPPLAAAVTGDTVVFSWNDLGMHCMNQDHAVFSVLPPYNNLYAQVVRRGDATRLPQLVTSGVTIEYSVPGNTYSVGKTDFWTWAQDLFGVALPPNVGLKGKGLSGTLDPAGDHYFAEGIPLTPFPDATPTVPDPYQNGLVIVRDQFGAELARSRPVVPVSTEVNCVTSGCHSSEQAIINGHDREGGFDPTATPILCAGCHGSPALGTTSVGSAGYFSFRIHDQHKFLDQTMPGIAGCNMCHPGQQTQCLRGTMATDHGMVCQDCHGNLQQVSSSIEQQGRIPWVNEPACRNCHTAQYGEPAGQLYRNSTGHGGLYCSACHGSPHAIFPSRENADNLVMIDLQGHAGILSDCTVCHGVTPDGAGPHGYRPNTTDVAELHIDTGTGRLDIYPSPLRRGATATIKAANAGATSAGRLLVFDARGRTVRLLHATVGSDGVATASWDGRDGHGKDVADGVYLMRWDDGKHTATGKVTYLR